MSATALPSLATVLSTAEARALHWRMSLDAWTAEQEDRAQKVQLFREYAQGDHRAELTTEMRKMLRIGATNADRSPGGQLPLYRTNVGETRFNDNYMDIVIQTMADRLRVRALETDNDAANEWIAGVLAANRFDALQGDVHEAAVRDADTYVMVSWDRDKGQLMLTHEPAFDGTNGMLVLAGPDNTVQCAIKVWRESHESINDTTRINVYYADRVEKYVSKDGSGPQQYMVEGEAWPAPWMYDGKPIGVPVIHFPNRGGAHDFYGLSEIENAIPLQDALNRTLYSMVMTAELTGFGVRWAKGFSPPEGIMPGDWIAIAAGGLEREQVAEVGVLEQGAITPYIEQARWLTAEIGKITRTPAPEFMGADNASGESLKQREIGLLGKVRRAQTKLGNRWEDMIAVAWHVEAAFGNRPPEWGVVNCVWDEAELRNDTEVIANAKVLADIGLVHEALRQMAPVFGWNEAKVDQLYEEYQQAQNATARAMFSNLPTFESALAGVQL